MADLSLNKVVTFILALVPFVIVVGGIITFYTPLGGMLNNWVGTVLDLGTQPVPFTGMREEATTATASVHALLYSINKVAWYDTYGIKSKDDATTKSLMDMAKDFKGSKAIPLYDQREKIIVGDSPKENAMEEITQKVIDCKKIYEDRGNINTGCFTLDFTGFESTISKKELLEYMGKYLSSPSCDDYCKNTLYSNLNLEFKMEEDGLISEKDEVKICAQQPGFLKKWKLYITDSDIEAAKICKLPDAEMNFGMKVINFHLPQEINTYDGISGPGSGIVKFGETWVNTYGDPEYVLYYQVFPEGEEAYWLPQAYVIDVAQILTIEGVFFALDMIPYVGKVMSGVLEKTGGKTIIKEWLEDLAQKVSSKILDLKTIKNILSSSDTFFHKIKAVLNFPTSAITDFFSNAKNKIIERVLNRGMTSEALEAYSLKAIKRYEHEFPKEIDSNLIVQRLGLKTNYLVEDFASNGRVVLDANGKFTREFKQEFSELMRREFEQVSQEYTQKTLKTLPGETFDKMHTDILEDMSNTILKSAKSPIAGLVRIADRSNSKIINRLGTTLKDFGSNQEEKEKIIKSFLEDSKYLESLKPDEIRRLSASTDKAIEYALEMQELNPEFLQGVLGDSFQGDITKLTREEAAKLLDERFETVLKGINPTAYSSGKVQSMLLKFAGKKRHMITALAVYSNLLDESIAEKFIPVGTNAIGLRTPYMATTIYDDEFTVGFDYSIDKERYKQFFTFFNGYVDGKEERDEKYLGYRGLLPEANRYYISLVKDKDSVINQRNQRLHFASPCKADLVVTKTVCECWGNPREDTLGKTNLPPLISTFFEKEGIYETGKYNEYYGKIIEDFDGKSKSLYTIAQNGVLVKECYHPNVGEFISDIWQDTIYKPSCIEINPLMDESLEYNYCYHGQTTPGMFIADIGLNYGLPIGATLLCAGTAVGAPICGAVGGIAGTFAYAWLNTGHQWPNHN